MRKITIVSDSSNDLNENYIDENNIKLARFFVRLNGDDYLIDGIDINREEFYEFLRDNPKIFPKTSLPSVSDYLDIFKESVENGEDIICFTVSSFLSGSYQSAKVAADIIKEENKESKIYVIDSESASLGVGILIEKAVNLRKEGRSIDYIYNIVSEIAKTTEIYISLETLDYLEHGGRLGKVGAFAGRMLNIKPIVSFRENKLNVEKAVRGGKKAIKEILRLLDERIGENPKDYEVFIVHGDEEKLANNIKKEIEDLYDIDIRFDASLVTPAIISHIGPGAIAIGSSKKI